MPFDIQSYSRFKSTDRIVFQQKATFGLWNPPQSLLNLNTENIERYKVEAGYEGRPDLISDEFYGSDRYAWVILMYNKPISTIGWPSKNEVIGIPKYDSVVGVL